MDMTMGNSPLVLANVDPDNPDWQQHGLCRRADNVVTEDFYVEGKYRSGREGRTSRTESNHLQKLRALCAACPVSEQCDTFADENHELGFWAGLTEDERLRRARDRIRKNALVLGFGEQYARVEIEKFRRRFRARRF